MLQAYRNYKWWWLVNEASNLVPSLYWGETEEEAFKTHINKMTLFELMELLEGWEDR